MKKIIVFLCFVIMLFSLSACDPGTFIISQDALKDVISIELIEYKNPSQKHFTSWVPNHFEDLQSFNTVNVTVIETLQDEKKTEFLDSFM